MAEIRNDLRRGRRLLAQGLSPAAVGAAEALAPTMVGHRRLVHVDSVVARSADDYLSAALVDALIAGRIRCPSRLADGRRLDPLDFLADL